MQSSPARLVASLRPSPHLGVEREQRLRQRIASVPPVFWLIGFLELADGAWLSTGYDADTRRRLKIMNAIAYLIVRSQQQVIRSSIAISWIMTSTSPIIWLNILP